MRSAILFLLPAAALASILPVGKNETTISPSDQVLHFSADGADDISLPTSAAAAHDESDHVEQVDHPHALRWTLDPSSCSSLEDSLTVQAPGSGDRARFRKSRRGRPNVSEELVACSVEELFTGSFYTLYCSMGGSPGRRLWRCQRDQIDG